MSTLKTHNLQSPDAGSVNIAMTQNAGMVVAGLSTYSNQINVGSNIKLGNAGVITATSFVGAFQNSGDFTIDDYVVHAGDTNTKFGFPAADSFSVETGGSLRFLIQSDGSIGINATSPSAGDLATGDSQNKPLLHVNGSGSSATTGEYNLLARFEAGTDADGTGAMIVLNHANDRGLAIQGGRRTGNYAHGALKMIDNVGRLSDAIFIHGGAGQGVNYMSFYTGESTTTTERLHIDSAGDVILKNNGGDNRIERDTTSGGPYLLFHNRGTGTTDSSGVYNLGGISAAGYRDVSNPSIVGSIQFERQPTAGGASSGCNIVFRTGFNGTTSHTHHSEKLRLTYEGHLLPGANNQYDLGSTARGWRNVYMNDLNLSNMKGDTNDVDGTQGSWTIQEGKDDLYIINRLNGKKFKIKMEEIS